MSICSISGVLPRRVLVVGAALAVAGLMAGCSSMDGVFGSSTRSDAQPASGSGDRLSNLVFGPAAAPGEGTVAPQQSEVYCPDVDVRPGASTLTIAPASTNPNAVGIRYQASIGRTARECRVSGGTMSIRVGVQARLVLGPLGGPGKLDVPIRYAVVQEGVEPKTIDTKLHRVPVTIDGSQATLSFTHVAEDLSFPVPSGDAITSYVVYVGFDPEAPKETRRSQRRR